MIIFCCTVLPLTALIAHLFPRSLKAREKATARRAESAHWDAVASCASSDEEREWAEAQSASAQEEAERLHSEAEWNAFALRSARAAYLRFTADLKRRRNLAQNEQDAAEEIARIYAKERERRRAEREGGE